MSIKEGQNLQRMPSIHELLCTQVQLQEAYGDMFVKNSLECPMVVEYDFTIHYNDMCATRDMLIKLYALLFLAAGSIILFGLVSAGMMYDFKFDDLTGYFYTAFVNFLTALSIFSLLAITVGFHYGFMYGKEENPEEDF